MSSITSVNLTPELAQKWLDQMCANRPITKAHVKRLASRIERGLWKCGDFGQPIKFNKRNQMIDGQHRCLAVIEAGVAVRIEVMSGCDDEARTIYGISQPETVYQTLAMRGIPNAKIVSGAIRIVRWILAGRVQLDGGSGYRIEAEDAILFIEKHPGIVNISSEIHAMKKKVLGPPDLWLGLYYLFRKVSESEAAVFLNDVAYGVELRNDSSAYVLREVLIRAHGKKYHQPTRNYHAAVIIKAFNARNRSVKILRFSGDEEFPSIDGLPL